MFNVTSPTSPSEGRKPLLRDSWPLLCAMIFCAALTAPYLWSRDIVFNYTDLYHYADVARSFETPDWPLFIKGRSTAFSYLIHLSFSAFGVSPLALKVLFTLFLFFLLVGVWTMAWRILGNGSGFLTAALIASSYTYGHFLYFPHIDLGLAAILTALLVMHHRPLLERAPPSKWFWLGIATGVAFLFKQTALLLLGVLPIYAMIDRWRFATAARATAAYVAGVSIAAIPWLVLAGQQSAVVMYEGHIKTFFEPRGGGGDSLPPSVPRILTYIVDPVFWQWQDRLSWPQTWIRAEQWLLVMGTVSFFLRRWKERKQRAFWMAVLLSYLPWYAYVAFAGFKYRQVLFLMTVLYLFLGDTLWAMGRRLVRPHFKQLPRTMMATVVTVLIGISILRYVAFLDAVSKSVDSVRPVRRDWFSNQE